MIRVVVSGASPQIRSHISRAAKATLVALPAKRKKNVAGILEITFISAAKMRVTNFQYRKKNRPTDVLSFSQLESDIPSPLVGEILICLSVIRKQAKQYEVSFVEELTRMAVHGVLHVFGYDHERSKAESKLMFGIQEKLVKRISPATAAKSPQKSRKRS